MSDYLGMLAARYLNQGSSIRPEPISIYQPPPADWELAAPSSPSEEVALDGAEGEPLFAYGSPGAAPKESGQAGGALPPVLSAADAASPIPPPAAVAAFVPSTSGEASFARFPSGEGASISSASGDGPDVRSHPSIPERAVEPTAQAVAPAGGPVPRSRIGEVASATASSRGEQREGVRDVPAGPLIVEREVETVGGRAVQAVRGVAAGEVPRRELVAPPPYPPPQAGEGIEESSAVRGHRREPVRSPRLAEATIPSASSAPSFAPSRTPSVITETTEPPPLRVRPSLTVPPMEPRPIEPPLQPFIHSVQGRRDTHAPAPPSHKGAGETAARGRDMNADAQPIVEISIDEINIRAAPPAAPPATPRRDRLVRPPMSLDDYLRRRAGSGR